MKIEMRASEALSIFKQELAKTHKVNPCACIIEQFNARMKNGNLAKTQRFEYLDIPKGHVTNDLLFCNIPSQDLIDIINEFRCNGGYEAQVVRTGKIFRKEYKLLVSW